MPDKFQSLQQSLSTVKTRVRRETGAHDAEAHEGAVLLSAHAMHGIYIDADGCPVKDEVYRVARRHGWKVYVVSNSPMSTPLDERIERVVVGGRFDEADDWIAGRIGPGDVAVTADIPLAARCLEKGATVISTKGHLFTEDSIGDSLATRELMSQLRQAGVVTGGPAPMAKQDRSRFLAGLEEAIRAATRKHPASN